MNISKKKNMKRSLIVCVVVLTGCAQGSDESAPAAQPEAAVETTDLANRLDAIVDELAKPGAPYMAGDANTSTHHMPYFLDSYAIRALCTQYALEQKPQYLAAAQAWANRVLDDQAKMIPFGAYYMNYGLYRQPGQAHGDWYVADSSSIAQGVLCTAHMSDHPDRIRYLESAQRFFDLVETNYINSDGGTSDGFWGDNRASWWASTSIFGAFAIAMYNETGTTMYLQRALQSFDWLSAADPANFMPEGAPGVVLYIGEFFVQAWPLVRGTPREDLAKKQLRFFFDWMAANQKSRNLDSPIDYCAHGQTYMAGLPYLNFTYGAPGGDEEVAYLRALLRSRIDFANVVDWSLTAWAAWSESAQLLALLPSPASVTPGSTGLVATN